MIISVNGFHFQKNKNLIPIFTLDNLRMNSNGCYIASLYQIYWIQKKKI